MSLRFPPHSRARRKRANPKYLSSPNSIWQRGMGCLFTFHFIDLQYHSSLGTRQLAPLHLLFPTRHGTVQPDCHDTFCRCQQVFCERHILKVHLSLLYSDYWGVTLLRNQLWAVLRLTVWDQIRMLWNKHKPRWMYLMPRADNHPLPPSATGGLGEWCWEQMDGSFTACGCWLQVGDSDGGCGW